MDNVDRCEEIHSGYTPRNMLKNRSFCSFSHNCTHDKVELSQVIHKMWKTYVNYVERGGYDFLEKTGGFA